MYLSAADDDDGDDDGFVQRVKTSKLLIIAGTDRLDNELTVAQMQGKYQLVIVPESGHLIQVISVGFLSVKLIAR